MKELGRREVLGAAVGGVVAACVKLPSTTEATMSNAPGDAAVVGAVRPLGFQWPTRDPFLFCVHHDDAFPRGNAELGPAVSLAGREIGMDFEPRDGWRMYHGERVPGFPQHPHRGFETVTVVRRGLVDHFDSLGATGRYGRGDVQWMTAGRGILHAEMFPLVDEQAPNPLELFQIWLNLPARSKMVAPHFAMLWADTIPRQRFTDAAGRSTTVTVVAGHGAGVTPLAPPPDSFAAQPEAEIAIWTIALAPGAVYALPGTRAGTLRTVYLVSGAGLTVAGRELPARHMAELEGHAPVELRAGAEPVELLLLQGRPIGEPVVQHGPFVMNTREEIAAAFRDYQRTGFGGWPWDRGDPVHPRAQGRFARHADGRVETPG